MKKILIINEASYLNSGFANYGRELIQRLVRSKKYKIAELASYGLVNDPRDNCVKWKFYANAVAPNDPRHGKYSERVDNQWGAWRFDSVLLDFKPDIVVSWADPWMFMYQMRTPMYEFFHHVIMPTVDSEPQKEVWIDYFSNASKILTYSRWGMDVLRRQGGKKMEHKLWKPAPFGVEESMVAMNDDQRKNLKLKYGIGENSLIIGMVARNQPRKLFPDLFESFATYLKTVDAKIAERSFLLCHTSWPDRGWNIPRLIQEYGIAYKTLFTYLCQRCSNMHISHWHGTKKHCPTCGTYSCMFPNVNNGVSRDQLCDVFNLIDLYCHLATAGGFEMPILEAASCGCQVMCTDATAMSDFKDTIDAIPLKPLKMQVSVGEDAYRAVSDNDLVVQKIIEFMSLSPAKMSETRKKVAGLARKNYNFDDIANIWMECFDSLEPKNLWETKRPAKIGNINYPDNIEPNTLIAEASNASRYPFNEKSYQGLSMIRDLYAGMTVGENGSTPFDKNKAIELYNSYINAHNIIEEVRAGERSLIEEDYIKYAKIKEDIYDNGIDDSPL